MLSVMPHSEVSMAGPTNARSAGVTSAERSARMTSLLLSRWRFGRATPCGRTIASRSTTGSTRAPRGRHSSTWPSDPTVITPSPSSSSSSNASVLSPKIERLGGTNATHSTVSAAVGSDANRSKVCAHHTHANPPLHALTIYRPSLENSALAHWFTHHDWALLPIRPP